MLTSLLVLASVVEARDPYTGGHLWRVAQFSRLLAEEAGLPRADIARVALGGFLHDLGKIAIPDAILHKPGPLTDPEYAVMKILDNCFAPRDVDGDGDREFETERSNLADITDHPLDGAIGGLVAVPHLLGHPRRRRAQIASRPTSSDQA